jgi:hypothetical protein
VPEILKKFIQRYGRLPTEFDPDYLEMLRMSKYLITDTPRHPPGKCANCGASKVDGRKYVDFGLQVDWYGTVYLDEPCLTDIAKAMGLFKKYEDEIAELKLDVQDVHQLHDQGVRLHETVVRTFEELKEFYGKLPSSGPSSSSTGSDSLESSKDSNSTPSVDANQSNVNEPELRIVKPPASTGRKNVSSLADLLKPDF